jgi:DNA-binding MarR family transcriptional regulator
MTKELDLSAMENRVCFNLRWVTRAVTQFFDAELRRHGIRPTQTPILAALKAKAAWSMEELSDWLAMERTTLIRNLRPLERDGLVEIAGAGRGGHVSVSISTKGRKELEKATPEPGRSKLVQPANGYMDIRRAPVGSHGFRVAEI